MNTPTAKFSRLIAARDDPLAELSNRMKIVSIIATSLCVSVVLLVLASYINRASRNHLDRVSFRMVVLALFNCLGFMWSLQFFGLLCSNVSLCIGLNLMLVMIWRQDGRKLEKWYFIGSILHALIVALPPVFAKAWGVDLPGHSRAEENGWCNLPVAQGNQHTEEMACWDGRSLLQGD